MNTGHPVSVVVNIGAMSDRNMESVIIDVSEWTRLAEVSNYARVHRITLEDAIHQLVNSGLSHEPRTYL